MVQIFRVVSEWQGFQGAPGYTNHFFRNIVSGGAPGTLDERASAQLGTRRVHAFWTRLSLRMPNDVKIDISNTVDVLEDSTGELTGSWQVDDQDTVQGQNAGSYSAAAGGVIAWSTAGIRNGRRVRGRTFVVPLAGDAFTDTGQLGQGIMNDLNGAGADLVNPAGLNTFGVWARPTGPGATNGVWHPVTSSKVNNKGAILRSRRD